MRLAAAFSQCSRGELATSLAARPAGLTYADFLEAAARAKVELFPIDIEELKREIARPLPPRLIWRELGENLAMPAVVEPPRS